MARRAKKITKRRLFIFLAVFFGFVLPLVLIIAGVIFFKITGPPVKEVAETERMETEERLTPSQILNNKFKYDKERLVMRGRVLTEPVVCERKECPSGDSCCGCPSQRDLVIVDSGTVMTSRTQGRLRLLDLVGSSLCQRRPSSCDYHCPDWVEGAIYDVGGTFSAQAPPPGWKMSLEYYFQVEDKSLVQRTAIGESIGNAFREIREMVKDLGTSGYYVLP